MSTTTTSASSLSAIPCATVAPTLPPPTTVTFVFIECPSGLIFARIIMHGRAATDEGTSRAFVPRPLSLVPASPMLADFCKTENAIAATTKKLEKERLLAEYLVALDDASLERAVVFFSGSVFP